MASVLLPFQVAAAPARIRDLISGPHRPVDVLGWFATAYLRLAQGSARRPPATQGDPDQDRRTDFGPCAASGGLGRSPLARSARWQSRLDGRPRIVPPGLCRREPRVERTEPCRLPGRPGHRWRPDAPRPHDAAHPGRGRQVVGQGHGSCDVASATWADLRALDRWFTSSRYVVSKPLPPAC